MSIYYVDVQKSQITFTLGWLLGINSHLDRFIYDSTEFEIESRLKELEKSHQESPEIQEAKNKLEVIKGREEILNEMKPFLRKTFYSIGIYIMVAVEQGKCSVEFAKKAFTFFVRFFKINDLGQTFKETKKDLFITDCWINDPENIESHFIDSSYMDRFYLLLNTLLVANDIEVRQPFEILNDSQLMSFRTEVERLKAKKEVWNELFVGESSEKFDSILKTLEISSLKRAEELHQKIIKEKLSVETVNKVKLDIIKYAQSNFEANYIQIEDVDNGDEDFGYLGQTFFYDKVFFIDKSIDPTTYYNSEDIGLIIGKYIGIGKTEYIIKQTLENFDIKGNKIFIESFSLENVKEVMKTLNERGFEATTLLIAYDLTNELRNLKGFFYIHRKSDEFPIPFGKIGDIEIYRSKILSEKTAIMFDRNKAGKLKISEKLKPEITAEFDIDEIISREIDRGKIREEDIKRRKYELEEKVKIQVIEKLKFEFGDKKAGIILLERSQR